MTICIPIDGSMQADLSWKEAKKRAEKAKEEGLSILWDMDLGLFENLKFPLDHQSQYLSLRLSLEHFRDTLWKEFQDHTSGLIIYKGSADFSNNFPWTHSHLENLELWIQDKVEQERKYLLTFFCREIVLEYLRLLTNSLPDTISRYLQLTIPKGWTTLWEAQILNREAFELFNLIIENGSLPKEEDVQIGICLPEDQTVEYSDLEQALNELIQKKIKFKIISEAYLTSQWDGLDYIVFEPKGLSSQGKRKLQGFCAAGGIAVSVGNLLGLCEEKQWSEVWKNL